MDIMTEFSHALRTEGKSDLTVKHYLSDLKSFAQWFELTNGEAFKPESITAIDVLDYRSYLLGVKGYRPSTINRKLVSLSRFCRWAKAEGLIDMIPTAEIKGVRETQSTAPKALSRQAWRKLLRTVHATQNKRNIAIVELMGNTGLRTGELVALRLADIELSPRKGRMIVRSGKGIKQRIIPLNTDARKALTAYIEVRPKVDDDHLFIGQRGNPLTRSGVRQLIKKLGKQAGFPELFPYVLRHTYATRLLREEGVDLVTVQTTMGHESPATTAKYTRPSEEEQAAALERLAIR